MARKWWTLMAASVATFMLLLDITVVNTALPRIQRELGASFSDLQWVIDAYTLTLAAFVLTSGSLADRLGRRRVFAYGIVIFTLASALCGFATTPAFLNISRAVQGVGGAILFAVSLALIAQEFIGKQRATAMGIYGGTIGISVAIGPLIGGALTTSFGWRWIFFLNIPIGLAALVITVTRLAESRDPHARGVDWPGVVLFGGANTALVFALLRGNESGWSSAGIVGLLVGAGALLVLFLAVEARVAQPMLPLGFFRNPTFTGAQVAAFAISASMFSSFLYITLYIQNVLGYSPIDAAIRFLPVTIAAFLVSPLAGIGVTKVPPRILLFAGLGIIAVGMLMMSGVKEGDAWTAILFGLVLGGVGIGLVNPVLANIALSTVPEEQSGVAAGVNDTFRQVGIAAGTAALGALFLARAQSRISEILPGADAHGLATSVSLGGIPAGLPAHVAAAARQGFFAGLSEILVLGSIVSAAGAILALVLVRGKDLLHREGLAPAA